MRPWKRILCGVDLSDASRAAVKVAAELAERSGAALNLLHVFESRTQTSEMLVAPVLLERAMADAESRLQPLRREAERRAGRPVELVVAQGDAAEELVRHVREGRFDVLVVAAETRGEETRPTLGAVAKRVARAAPCSVVLVRAPRARGRTAA